MLLGDVVQLGRHRLMCGDATNSAHVAELMAGQRADLVFTSPPYLQQRAYVAGVGDWDTLMQGVFLDLPVQHGAQVLVNLGLVHRECEWQPYWYGWVEWMRTIGWRRFGWYVWDKLNGMAGDWAGRLAPSFEFIFHFNKVARKPNKTKPKLLSSIGYNRRQGSLRKRDGSISPVSNPAAYLATHKIPDSVLRLHPEKGKGLERKHPAVFPVKLPLEIITAYSDADQIVYEPFAGSGSTILAAAKCGRLCYAMEMEPAYCDIAIERFRELNWPDKISEFF